jgi:prepilin-type N-terminal cleavage/methylation domain-containing protein
MKLNWDRKGFTLIEILIVVAIIGILASVVLVGLGPVQRRGRDARRISDLRQIQTALELYYNINGSYPAPAGGNIVPRSALVPAVVPNLPKDPGGSEYMYGTDSGNASYVVGAKLEESGNPAMSDAPQSALYGVNCGKTPNIYCVQL